MHRQISINTLSLAEEPFDQHVAQVASLGATAIGPGIEQVASFGAKSAARMLRDAGLSVATLTHRAFAFTTPEAAQEARARLDATIAVAQEIGARTITLTTGGRGPFSWPDAATRFAAEIAPCARRAEQAGVILSLEPTSHLYADASIAHRLADTSRLSRMAGIGVGIDLFACWVDADIETAIIEAGPHIALVQVSDYAAGDRGLPCRAFPGDGIIPLKRLVACIARTGFSGHYDIEVIGPRLTAQNRSAGLSCAADRLASWIDAA